MPRFRAFWAVTVGVAFGGCETPSPASGWIMIEKGPYQLLYQPDGKIERLLYDQNGDGRADMVVMYGANGKPSVSEIDGNIDGVVDRWEYFDESGDLAKTGRARRQPGKPDVWDVVDKTGETSRLEFDEDGDGKVDRTEYVSRGKVFLEELDTDHDGKPDRRLFRDPDGALLKIEADKDEDGFWETSLPVQRRIVHREPSE
jgi:hypothetical protein